MIASGAEHTDQHLGTLFRQPYSAMSVSIVTCPSSSEDVYSVCSLSGRLYPLFSSTALDAANL